MKGSVGSAASLGLEAADAVRDSGRFWDLVQRALSSFPQHASASLDRPDAGNLGCGLVGEQRCRECGGSPLARNTRGAIFLGGVCREFPV